MEKIKKQIIELLSNSSETAHRKGSFGELGDSFQAIDSDCFSDVANEITNFIQIIFDPENQPNQLGINNPFEQNDDGKDEFEKAVEPAIRYLFKNHDPHTKIYINYDNAELLQGRKCHNLNDEVPD
jgi:hypothetical protein